MNKTNYTNYDTKAAPTCSIHVKAGPVLGCRINLRQPRAFGESWDVFFADDILSIIGSNTFHKFYAWLPKNGLARMHNKRLEALRNNPGGDWTPADLEITASQYAMKFRKVTGTHEIFTHPSVPNCVAIPLKKRIRAVHVRAFVEMVDRMDELDQ